MPWTRSSTVATLPDDPVGEVVAAALSEILRGSSVELRYSPAGDPWPPAPGGPTVSAARGGGPAGWNLQWVIRLEDRVGRLLTPGSILIETLEVLPDAGLATAKRLRNDFSSGARPLPVALRRAVRDVVAAEVLHRFLRSRLDRPVDTGLIERTIEYLVELSGSRVESHDLTHGVVISGVLPDPPRLKFQYPADVRAAKRAPLLFDGLRSVLIIDPSGFARTEVQAHRPDHLERLGVPAQPARRRPEDIEPSGALVAEATRMLGGLGFFLRADRTIWAFVDGQPVLVRRGEHWMTFPLQLASTLSQIIGGGTAALIVARAAFRISGQRQGAILAVVQDANRLDGAVPLKDRYDLRDSIDPLAMRAETRLHHLIDADELDEHTLARLAELDGATIIDQHGKLVAYGAIVPSSHSEHEGARTAAAKTLSGMADVVLKVSADGDITIFRNGEQVSTLLRRPSQYEL